MGGALALDIPARKRSLPRPAAFSDVPATCDGAFFPRQANRRRRRRRSANGKESPVSSPLGQEGVTVIQPPRVSSFRAARSLGGDRVIDGTRNIGNP